MANDAEGELHLLKHELQHVLREEEEILYQKTREKWISKVDKNSKFFHALIRGRQSRTKIQLRGTGDSITTEPQVIREMAVMHFHDLFTASSYYLDDDLFDGYPTQVTTDMDMSIC